jgi:hypothetical protein
VADKADVKGVAACVSPIDRTAVPLARKLHIEIPALAVLVWSIRMSMTPSAPTARASSTRRANAVRMPDRMALILDGTLDRPLLV